MSTSQQRAAKWCLSLELAAKHSQISTRASRPMDGQTGRLHAWGLGGRQGGRGGEGGHFSFVNNAWAHPGPTVYSPAVSPLPAGRIAFDIFCSWSMHFSFLFLFRLPGLWRDGINRTGVRWAYRLGRHTGSADKQPVGWPAKAAGQLSGRPTVRFMLVTPLPICPVPCIQTTPLM